MKKLDRVMGTFETWSFVVLLSVMTVVVFLQVVFRYVIRSSLPWSEELSRYCMVFTTFIGVSAGLRAGTHTCVDFVVSILPPQAKYWAVAVGHVVTMVFSLLFGWIGLKLCIEMSAYGQFTPALRIPTWIPYASIPFGFLCGVIRCAENLVEHLRTRGLEQDAPAKEAV